MDRLGSYRREDDPVDLGSNRPEWSTAPVKRIDQQLPNHNLNRLPVNVMRKIYFPGSAHSTNFAGILPGASSFHVLNGTWPRQQRERLWPRQWSDASS